MPYNPNQPRDPGGKDGGRWVKAAGRVGGTKKLKQRQSMAKSKVAREKAEASGKVKKMGAKARVKGTYMTGRVIARTTNSYTLKMDGSGDVRTYSMDKIQ